MQNLSEDLRKLLSQDQRFVMNGNLLKNKVVECALKFDADLIALLLTGDTIKSHFFTKVGEVLVFDKIKFQKFVSNKQFLPDSYTTFKNKIGLTVEDNYLAENKAITLSWAYKDCVLEGGQSKEEEKNNEIFWNEILSPDEIDKLFAPKVFTCFKRFTVNGEEEVNEITANDNLIIKGNNLIALHSLAKIKSISGNVKLIYIDPPYNTGNDSFKYNDSFNHSTWLTFMKNRLTASKNLLSRDGCILVQIDNSPSALDESPELGYLLVLMDEIFGRNNYLTTFIWKKKGNPSNTEKNIGTITESILMYAKDIRCINPNIQEYKRKYSYIDEKGEEYNLEHPVKTNEGTYERSTMLYGIETSEGIFYPPKGKRWTIGKDTAKKIVSERKYHVVNGEFRVKKYSADYKRGEAKLYSNLLLEHGSLKSAKDELQSLGFDREAFDSPKPEILIKTLIEITTNENDLILDYHLGSGTTAAVAHKLKRRYIGIEQMDYIRSLTVTRLCKVISGEQGGISKELRWQGGGEFIYCELAMSYESLLSEIKNADSSGDIKNVVKKVLSCKNLDYRIDTKLFETDDFMRMDIQNQKRMLLNMLDKNMFYLPYCSIKDGDYRISHKDIMLNEKLYSL
jgi:adenine-specific DNA-methyltransferase